MLCVRDHQPSVIGKEEMHNEIRIIIPNKIIIIIPVLIVAFVVCFLRKIILQFFFSHYNISKINKFRWGEGFR